MLSADIWILKEFVGHLDSDRLKVDSGSVSMAEIPGYRRVPVQSLGCFFGDRFVSE
jgi:hypothetical protein